MYREETSGTFLNLFHLKSQTTYTKTSTDQRQNWQNTKCLSCLIKHISKRKYCLYIYIYMCVCVCVCVCVFACVYLYVYLYVYICVYICEYVYICIHTQIER